MQLPSLIHIRTSQETLIFISDYSRIIIEDINWERGRGST